ncbi:hypothetical protein VPNG_06816 [Cytospora leucostoma]|uniref:Uncharacterized protein n=1 Tax=Cytospora leucostoma TaxID=1230097 RepID=A0A423WVZ1_9PEZI|nr:hypothetical protein VPNG_06816 [Cytospora leucostoma]
MAKATGGEEVFLGPYEHNYTTAAGRDLKVEFRAGCFWRRSEAEMMDHAATNGIRAPRLLGFYDVITSDPMYPLATARFSESVPGGPLQNTLLDLSKEEQASSGLSSHARMRSYTQLYIGRINN